MNGIEIIKQKIADEAKVEVDAVISKAEKEAEAIKEKGRRMSVREKEALVEAGERKAEEVRKQIVASASLEQRKAVLALKQEFIEKAFERAAEELEAEGTPDVRTQLRLRRPEISTELASFMFKEQ